MLTYKCKNCGGEMEIGSSTLVCPYCGTKAILSDSDFKDNERFRKVLLQYRKAEAENKENDYSTDKIWIRNGTDSFTMSDGRRLNIEYMKKYSYDRAVCYLAQKNIIYVFDEKSDADAFLSGVNRLQFPPADSKLYRSFPELSLNLELKGNKKALAFKRRPNFYPSELFMPFESVHLAWVISRIENICCALQYSGIEHGDITPYSVWINPITHEGALFGEWRNVTALRGNKDLDAIRKTAVALAKNARDPIQMYNFLNSAPEADAFSDFEKWDKVIIDGFGGHKFTKM